MMERKSLSKDEIKQILAQNQEFILGFGIKRLGLFGSFVRNEQKSESDLDFLAEFYKGKKNYTNFIHLVWFLEDKFQKKVDLLTMESLAKDSFIASNILKEVEFYVPFNS